MDLAAAGLDVDAVRDAVVAADVVVPVGARTHWEVGGRAPVDGTEVRAPSGIVAYDPADLTVTAGAGTPVHELDALLADHGQECGLDPRDANATVGGVLAAGVSGLRRLRHGPVRDTVLEVRFVTGDGRVVKGGGPTVKNVTGYDLPRLLVGSLGTLGVMTQVTLRCRPRAASRAWMSSPRAAAGVLRALFRPSSVLSDGKTTFVLLEGVAADIDAEAAAAGLEARCDAPPVPIGAHRGRISVAPGALDDVVAALDGVAGCRFLAEYGVGTVHVAGDDSTVLRSARAVAQRAGGWLLREAGGDETFEGFGVAPANHALQRRIKDAFDPAGKCNPGRLPW